jgi:hypothetical protein
MRDSSIVYSFLLHYHQIHDILKGRTGIAQSIWRLATCWTVRGSDPIGGGEIFRTCSDQPWGYPASCAMDTGTFPGVKRAGRGVDHPPPSSAEVKERVELCLYFTSGASWPVLGRPLPLLKGRGQYVVLNLILFEFYTKSKEIQNWYWLQIMDF